MTDTATATPEAPATVPESAPATEPGAGAGYESFVFPHREEPQPEAAKAPEESARTAPVEAKAPAGDDDLPDDAIERVLKHPKAQSRLDQLVNNKYGNELQKARGDQERIRREAVEEHEQSQRQRAEVADTWKRLSEDDSFFDEQVARHGRPTVLEWMAKAERAMEAEKTAPPAADVEAVKAEYGTAFNHAAVNEFKTIAKATLPFWGDLPDETRAHIESLAYVPDDDRPGGWLADALSALAAGVGKHLDQVKRSHREELDQARMAGKNEAIAAREDAGPVMVAPSSGSAFTSWTDVMEAYAAGRMSREQFHIEAKNFKRSLS